MVELCVNLEWSAACWQLSKLGTCLIAFTLPALASPTTHYLLK
jgi:hypothetical protein